MKSEDYIAMRDAKVAELLGQNGVVRRDFAVHTMLLLMISISGTLYYIFYL